MSSRMVRNEEKTGTLAVLLQPLDKIMFVDAKTGCLPSITFW